MISHFYEFDPKKHGINERVRLVIYNNTNKDFSHKLIVEKNEIAKVCHTELMPLYDFKYKYQRLKQGQWEDITNYHYNKNEKTDHNGIKYLYFPHTVSKYLLVIFQAMNETPGYNYVKTLKGMHHNKLFIKDEYGEDAKTRSSYYLGKNKTTYISDATIKLIERKRMELGIKKQNVICCGSSKGGYAALYHSYKANYGHCICGGPQTLLGNFLSNSNNPKGFKAEILRFLTGGDSPEHVDWLNQVLFHQIEKSSRETSVNLHVGKGDHHYEEHALPLASYLIDSKINMDIGNYSTHEELAQYFPIYLLSTVKTITSCSVNKNRALNSD